VPPRINIDKCGVRAGGGVCTPRSQGWVDDRFSARLNTPKAVLEPHGTAWKESVAIPFPHN